MAAASTIRRTLTSCDLRNSETPSPVNFVGNLKSIRFRKHYVHHINEATTLFVVSTVFQDRLHQVNIFHELIQLKNTGATAFTFAIYQSGIDILFYDRVLSGELVKMIRRAEKGEKEPEEPLTPISTIKTPSPPASPRLSSHSVRLSWGVEEAEVIILEDEEEGCNVDVLFDSNESQYAISKDLDLMNALKVQRFAYSLDETRVLFNFRTEQEARIFFSALQVQSS